MWTGLQHMEMGSIFVLKPWFLKPGFYFCFETTETMVCFTCALSSPECDSVNYPIVLFWACNRFWGLIWFPDGLAAILSYVLFIAFLLQLLCENVSTGICVRSLSILNRCGPLSQTFSPWNGPWKPPGWTHRAVFMPGHDSVGVYRSCLRSHSIRSLCVFYDRFQHV